MLVIPCNASLAAEVVVREHYLHRKPPCSFAWALMGTELLGEILGVVTFGTPPSLLVVLERRE
jgi:hypothetical protein